MHLNGTKLSVLDRADECGRVLDPTRCGIETILSGADRGIIVAFVELLEAELAKRDAEIARLRTTVYGTGGHLMDGRG